MRGAIGVIVGQLFALQLLFASVIATKMDVASLGLSSPVCITDTTSSSDDTTAPHPHLQRSGCAICALASLVAPPPQPQAVLLSAPELDQARRDVRREAINEPERFDPRCSQGPPQRV